MKKLICIIAIILIPSIAHCKFSVFHNFIPKDQKTSFFTNTARFQNHIRNDSDKSVTVKVECRELDIDPNSKPVIGEVVSWVRAKSGFTLFPDQTKTIRYKAKPPSRKGTWPVVIVITAIEQREGVKFGARFENYVLIRGRKTGEPKVVINSLISSPPYTIAQIFNPGKYALLAGGTINDNPFPKVILFPGKSRLVRVKKTIEGKVVVIVDVGGKCRYGRKFFLPISSFSSR